MEKIEGVWMYMFMVLNSLYQLSMRDTISFKALSAISSVLLSRDYTGMAVRKTWHLILRRTCTSVLRIAYIHFTLYT